ncbi:RHS repeat-associated core domain-containing protein [Streptomyces sp. NPDC048057]|uniref:RHS repeat-associated core domain-containing protein n=1 Tax=Streptomyces sp. NPDC048057 TaxID=3155628 RepID=UPI0033C6D1DA
MGYTIPEGVDTMLDVVGVGWPNVDEDAYRDMADALREFATDADDDAGTAHGHIQRLLSTGQSESLTALDKHWKKVQGKNKDLAGAARIIAGALDRVADIIVARKIAAVGELADLCATVGIALAAAPFTMGLTTLLAGGKIVATRIAFKKILKEMAEAAVAEITATLTQPAVAALESIVTDLAIQTAMDVTGADGSTQINSAGGGGSGPGGTLGIDHDAHGSTGSRLANVQVSMDGRAKGKIDKAKGHHGRAKGKDSLTAVLDGTIEGVVEKLIKGHKHLGDHVGKKLPDALGQSSKTHRNTDKDIDDRIKKITGSGKRDDDDLTNKRTNPSDPARKHPDDTRTKPNSLNGAQLNARANSIPPSKRTCETDPVDVATGEMQLAQTDLSLPGVLPLVLSRTHLSGYRYGHWFGRSWASTLDERIELDPRGQGALWARDDGTVLLYPRLPTPDDPDGVLPLEGEQLPLTHAGVAGDVTTYAVTDPQSGLVRSFSGSPYHASTAYWLTEVEDRHGNGITLHRTPDGAPTRVVHDGGYHVALTTRSGRVHGLSLRTPDGPVTVLTYGYDHDGNLDAVTNSSGLPLRFGYDTDARMTSWTDRNDSTYRYAYDPAGRVTRTVGPDGYLSSSFTYEPVPDSTHTVTRYTNALGATTVYRVNDRLQVVAVTDPLGHTFLTGYDADDRVVSVTDPLGRTAQVAYDGAGRPTAVTRADGHRTTAEYTRLGQLAVLTEPDGATWHHGYDGQGNRVSLTDPAGETTEFTYDGRGGLTSVTDPVGRTIRVERSPAGLATAITDPAGSTTRQEHDPFGRPSTLTTPLGGPTRLAWSVEGRLVARTGPEGSTEQWTYDGEGNCVTHTDPQGRVTTYEYTHFDLPVAVVTPAGVRHTYAFDGERRLTHVTDPLGSTWTYRYDAAGRLTGETDYDGSSSGYAYDPVGQLTSRTNAAGQETTYGYDTVGNLIEKSVDGARIRYENDPCGRLLHATGPDAALTFSYDPAGRVVGEAVDGRTLSTACDPSGRRTRRTTPSGTVTTYAYDDAGQLATLTAAGRALAFEYNATGREVHRRITDSLSLTHTWDTAGRLTEQTLLSPASPDPLQQRTYAYRGDGPVTAVTDRNGERTYTLDEVGRVTGVSAPGWTETYRYDERGNQTFADWPASHPGNEARGDRSYRGSRLARAGNVRYEYDAQGRVVLRQKARLSRKPDTWRYEWDAEDHLTAVTTPDGTRWRYRYDPLGRRIAKQRLAPDGTTVAEETRFVWDGSTLVEQTTHLDGVPEAITLTWDHRDYTPLTQIETKALATAPQEVIDQRFFAIVTDRIGTPTELVDEATGAVAWYTRSTLWGATVWNSDATAHTPLRFPGQYFDPETGLHHNYFRHYDPETARYLTTDPLGLAAALNPTAYVDNPLTLSDPLGLAPCDEADVSWGGRVIYGTPGPGGRATTMHATIGLDMTGGRTNPSAKVPGYQKYKKLNKTHLLGAQIGGSNKDARNFVTMHRYANSPVMRKIEDQIRKAVDDDKETIQYTVKPVYRTDDPTDVVPVALTIEVYGNKGFQFEPYEGGSRTNEITILNVPKPANR